MIRGWSNRRVEQVSETNLVKAKRIAYWTRALKLFSRFTVMFFLHVIVLEVLATRYVLMLSDFFAGLTILSLIFLSIKFVDKLGKIGGFVDGKFRKTIPNNNTTK